MSISGYRIVSTSERGGLKRSRDPESPAILDVLIDGNIPSPYKSQVSALLLRFVKIWRLPVIIGLPVPLRSQPTSPPRHLLHSPPRRPRRHPR